MMARRAAILKETLEFFDIYGELLPIILAEQRADDKRQDYDGRFDEFIRSLADEAATRSAKERTELNATAQDTLRDEVVRNFKALSKADQTFLIDEWKRRAEQHSNSKSLSPQSSEQEDTLDRYYSEEVVDKLPLIIERASHLSPLQATTVTPLAQDIERYFSEAHQCYLYGFPVACAVLCRAIVEAVLKIRLPGKFDDLGDRIEAAHSQGLLSQERRVWAYEVKDAGNHAIHQYERLARSDLSRRVEECLLKTRAFVEELLVVPTAREEKPE